MKDNGFLQPVIFAEYSKIRAVARGGGGGAESATKTGKIRENGKKKGKLGRLKWEACREIGPAEGKGWLRP